MKAMDGNIKVSETELIAKMIDWIAHSEVDELAQIAEQMFGGEIYWLAENDEENPDGENHYEIFPNELYGGAFGAFPQIKGE